MGKGKIEPQIINCRKARNMAHLEGRIKIATSEFSLDALEKEDSALPLYLASLR